jgi:hypothetical protein
VSTYQLSLGGHSGVLNPGREMYYAQFKSPTGYRELVLSFAHNRELDTSYDCLRLTLNQAILAAMRSTFLHSTCGDKCITMVQVC